MKKLKPGIASLRAHDLHQGLQAGQVERGHGLVGEELEATQTIGMAAALATAIKGIEIVESGADLKRVASQQLDIDAFALDRVIRVLEETEFVRNVQRDSGGRVIKLYESVPEDFNRLYATLDDVYKSRGPGELEKTLIAVVDDLSMGPRPVDQLAIDPELRERLFEIGDIAEAVKRVEGRETIAYSPYFSYEHPEAIGKAVKIMDVEAIRDAFERVRGYQGLPITDDAQGQIINGLVAAGVMAGPGLLNPKGQLQSFGMAPYGLPPDLLRIRKPILDKAMAAVAAVRMGQHFGGLTDLKNPTLILRRLLEGNWVARHPSTRRQYGVLHDLGIVRFEVTHYGSTHMQLITTADNKQAVRTAIDLLTYGEAMRTKEMQVAGGGEADRFRTPIQTVRPARSRKALPKKTVADLWATAMSQKPLV